MEFLDNVGVKLTVDELIRSDFSTIFNGLKTYISKFGYKKRRGDTPGFDQEDAWRIEIPMLQDHLRRSRINRSTYVLLEYMLPNENTERPDVILLFENTVVVLELKTIGSRIKKDYVNQFIDYRKMLNQYHKYSIISGMSVCSFLIMCGCDTNHFVWGSGVRSNVSDEDAGAIIGKELIPALFSLFDNFNPMASIEVDKWIKSSRSRSPKIWKQGKQIKDDLQNGTNGIYSKVSNIPYADLAEAQDHIFDLINTNSDQKQIVFISGVPGAGKTLIGMITLFGCHGDKRHARYYTGNGALKNVLERTMDTKDITLFSSFRNNYIKRDNVCKEEVLVFDEAQRFWDGTTNGLVITDAKGIIDANYGPKITLVCLIGDGQKPMTGEAGIEAWVAALRENPSWRVYAPEELNGVFEGTNYTALSGLYLDVARRQHFVNLADWVEAVLQADLESAKAEFQKLKNQQNESRFGIKLTRSLQRLYQPGPNGTILERMKAKREAEENTEYLFGILCSSKNDMDKVAKATDKIINRSNTYIDNKEAYEWYTGQCCDTRNIRAATETFCQGLEVDLPIIVFGGDYRIKNLNGHYSWEIAPSYYAMQKYGDGISAIMGDTYRILLTRATEEMIVVIPDIPELSDTYKFFKACGIEEY